MKMLETTGVLSDTFPVDSYCVVVAVGLLHKNTNSSANVIIGTWFQMLYCRELFKGCTINCVPACSMSDLNSSFLV
jgi:hypothetical protein